MWNYLNKGISTPIAIAIVLVLAIIVGGVAYWQYTGILEEGSEIELPEKLLPSSQYNLVYCVGHSDIVNEIKISNGEVIKPERKGYLTLEAYDYQCYLFDTDNHTKEELTIQELNNLDLIVSENSPDSFRIIREKLEPAEGVTGGLTLYKVFLAKDSTKRLIYDEAVPVEIFKLIGWVTK